MADSSATCSIFDSTLPDIREEIAAVQESARAFLGDRSARDAVRTAMATERGYDAGVYREAIGLGWAMINVPEDLGGLAMGDRALAVVFYEMGRALFCGPMLSTVGWAIPTLLCSGSRDQAQRWVPALVAGEMTATVMTLEGTANDVSGAVRLSGTGRAIDGHTADIIIAQTSHGSFVVHRSQFEAQRLYTLDQTRRLATVTIDTTISNQDRLRSPEPLDEGRCHAWVAIASEQAGGASACVDMAAQYAGVRRQFGKPIGAFQAIAHSCAEMFLQSTSAWSAALGAARALDARAQEADSLSRVAKTYASDAYFDCAARNLQVHGGIGFTWEHDAHLHLKRARAGRAILGTPSEHLESLAVRLLD